MSKTITIRAADSALAMEEVVRQLGPDALILSSKRRDGQFEIEAMVEDEDLPAPVAEAEEEAPAKPALAERLSKAAFENNDSDVAKTSPATFEALLKRRLDEDKVVVDETSMAAKAEALAEALGLPRPGAAAAPSEGPQEAPVAKAQPVSKAATPVEAEAPMAQTAPEAAPAPAMVPKRKTSARPILNEAELNAPLATPASDAEPAEPLFARYKPGKPTLVASNDAPIAQIVPSTQIAKPRANFSGLGALEIPVPELPDHIAQTLQEDIHHFDTTGTLPGLSRAIASALVPERVTEALGAGRFWVAGPDMRQKALSAIRLAIRKLDAGEEKPAFYVVGNEARADAAYLAAKADLLGLQVSLVDESVGRNLPDDAQGSQIVILPDDAAKAKIYADKFKHDGDRGLFVVPTTFARQALEPILAEWADMETQALLCVDKFAGVPAELVACLLQFNWQVGWTSTGEDILDNLAPAQNETVTDWMRTWVPEHQVDTATPEALAVFRSAHYATAQ